MRRPTGRGLLDPAALSHGDAGRSPERVSRRDSSLGAHARGFLLTICAGVGGVLVLAWVFQVGRDATRGRLPRPSRVDVGGSRFVCLIATLGVFLPMNDCTESRGCPRRVSSTAPATTLLMVSLGLLVLPDLALAQSAGPSFALDMILPSGLTDKPFLEQVVTILAMVISPRSSLPWDLGSWAG